MKGSFRVIAGLVIAFGAVGTLDYDPTANLALQVLIAAVGLAIMWWGTKSMEKNGCNEHERS